MFTLSIELIVYVCFVLQDISDLLCLRSKGKVPNTHPVDRQMQTGALRQRKRYTGVISLPTASSILMRLHRALQNHSLLVSLIHAAFTVTRLIYSVL